MNRARAREWAEWAAKNRAVGVRGCPPNPELERGFWVNIIEAAVFKACEEESSRLAALEEVVEQLPVCDYSINAVGEPCCEPATSYEIRRGDVLYYCERHSKGFPDDCRLPYRSALLKLLALKGGK